MSQISTLNANAPARETQAGNSIQDLDLDVFLNLMLTELQNQDPLNPMDNQEMLNTISQIREISANDKLGSTLDSVLLGQNVATATGLIGTEVEGITDEGRRIVGEVRQVAINDGEPTLELAVEAAASAGEQEGQIVAGSYTYELVWETEDGVFSVPIQVDTDDLGEDFQGSIRLDNLPTLDSGVVREVYRSEGNGPARYVGNLPSGRISTFTDTRATSDLGANTVPENRTPLIYADALQVRLSNIGSVQTIQR